MVRPTDHNINVRESNREATYGSINQETYSAQVFHEVVIPKNLWSIICSLWLSSFLSAIDTTIVSTTANAIGSAMGASGQMTWIATSYLITNTIFQPLVGKLSDIFGRRTVLMIAQFWFALGCLCCAFSRNVTEFAISRALAGIGGGGMSALSSIITTDIVPLRIRGVYQGYSNLMYAVGQFSGPVIGSIFLTVDKVNGWRWMFAFQVPLVLVAAVFVRLNVHDYRADQIQEINSQTSKLSLENFKRVDLPGSFLLSCIIVSVLMIFGSKSSFELYLWSGILLLSSTSFYVVEKYLMTVHVIPPHAFKGVLRLTAFIILFGGGSLYSLNFVLPIYCQVLQDFTQIQLGVFNTFAVFASGGGSLLAGHLLNHEEKVHTDVIVAKTIKLTVYCCVGFFLGSFICLLAATGIKPAYSQSDIHLSNIAILLGGYIVSSVSYGAFLVVLLILVVGKVGIKHQASVTGMNYMFRSMGQSAGVGITLSFYDHILSSELSSYFMKKSRRAEGTEIFHKLMASTFYIRNGLPERYVKKVLKIYRSSISDTMIIVFLMACIALGLSISLKFYPNETRRIGV